MNSRTECKARNRPLPCQHIESLESRQLLSASATDLGAPPHHDHHSHHAHHHLHVHKHDGVGSGNWSNVIIGNGPVRQPLPTWFVEPKVNENVTQWQDFSGNPLFAPGGPSPNDVAQRYTGDCWFLAGLAETALRDPFWIKDLIHQRADGTYDVVFYTGPKTTIDENVDGKLPLDSSGSLEYAQLGQNGCTWVAIMEKAFTYFRDRSIPANYANISGGWAKEVMADLDLTPFEMLPSVSNFSQLFVDVSYGLYLGQCMEIGTDAVKPGPLVKGHAYSVIATRVHYGMQQIEVRNPWGFNSSYTNNSNFDATNDGYMWVDAKSLLPQLGEFTWAKL